MGQSLEMYMGQCLCSNLYPKLFSFRKMVRNYIKKANSVSHRRKLSKKESIWHGLDVVWRRRPGKVGMNAETLGLYVRGKRIVKPVNKIGRESVFNEFEEERLAEHVGNLCALFHGLCG